MSLKLPVNSKTFRRCSSSMGPPGMDFGGLLRLLHSGVTTNFWGLGCPAYCGASSLPALALAFVLGFLFAACLAAWIFFHVWLHERPPASPRGFSPSTAAVLRLRQYVDARR